MEIVDIDRNGVMLGKLMVVDENGKHSQRRGISDSYAYTLVKSGLAWVDRWGGLGGVGALTINMCCCVKSFHGVV